MLATFAFKFYSYIVVKSFIINVILIVQIFNVIFTV